MVARKYPLGVISRRVHGIGPPPPPVPVAKGCLSQNPRWTNLPLQDTRRTRVVRTARVTHTPPAPPTPVHSRRGSAPEVRPSRHDEERVGWNEGDGGPTEESSRGSCPVWTKTEEETVSLVIATRNEEWGLILGVPTDYHQ